VKPVSSEDPADLHASCWPCNHHGANVKHENRVNRQEIAALERVIEEQQAVIEQLVAQLAEYENGAPAGPTRRPMPTIY
jgi:cell division protein FtsB